MKSKLSILTLLILLNIVISLAFCQGLASETRLNESRVKLLASCEKSGYYFTAEVCDAYMTYIKQQTLCDLKNDHKQLPKDFIDWIDTNPAIASGVYSAHNKPAEIMQWMYSLYLDLGETKFKKYNQLALAMSILCVKQHLPADISYRTPMQLNISGDPRKPVNTKDTSRQLDMNDHIINFLNDNTIDEEVVIGYEEEPDEIRYDSRGIAIPAPKKKGKTPVKQIQRRSLYAADIIASRELQEKFNLYMSSKGYDVNINCGEKIIHWNSHDMVRGEQYKSIKQAYDLFLNAYYEKGLIPKREPLATPAERCLFLIRNNEFKFPAGLQEKRNWPRFPLNAPWPILIMLAEDSQPLRERQERWEAFVNDGVFKTYGEYIGSVAQQYDMQSARRIKPYDFPYGSIQMMLKDGGVCGTMGNISARSHNTLGIPSCTAGQPGHCAAVHFRYDPKTNTYACKGSQYATGGDDKTTPHVGWYFGEVEKHIKTHNGKQQVSYDRKPMVYQQSIAWAVNYGMPEYMDSMKAFWLYKMLPDDLRGGYGLKLLRSGVNLNPYNYVVVEQVLTDAGAIEILQAFLEHFTTTVTAVQKQGCPSDGLYNTTVKDQVFSKIVKLPLPNNKNELQYLYEYLLKQGCQKQDVIVKVMNEIYGLDTLQHITYKKFVQHLRSRDIPSNEVDKVSRLMADQIKATASYIKNKDAKKAWGQRLLKRAYNNEKYFDSKYRLVTDPSVVEAARLAGKKFDDEQALVKPVLYNLAVQLENSVCGVRTAKSCKDLSQKINGAFNVATKNDSAYAQEWLMQMQNIIQGKESYIPADVKKRAKQQRDPCAETIKKLLKK